MELGTRFVHTADWQIGLRANHVPGDHGAAARLARYDAVKRIADVARDAEADFVVVAGDVFEHHALAREPLQQAVEALRAFPCDVFLLPGNHDPYTPDSLYRSAWWTRECPSHVKVLWQRKPVDVGAATLLPCPLLERDNHDPTAWLGPNDGPADRVRVGVAHGGVREILQRLHPDENAEFHNDLPIGLSDRAGLDYLAPRARLTRERHRERGGQRDGRRARRPPAPRHRRGLRPGVDAEAAGARDGRTPRGAAARRGAHARGGRTGAQGGRHRGAGQRPPGARATVRVSHRVRGVARGRGRRVREGRARGRRDREGARRGRRAAARGERRARPRGGGARAEGGATRRRRRARRGRARARRGRGGVRRRGEATRRRRRARARALGEANAHNAEVARFEQLVASVPITDADVAEARALEARVRALEEVEARSPVRVTLRPLSAVRVQVGARETPRLLTAGAEVKRPIASLTTIVVGDQLEIVIDPGRGPDEGSAGLEQARESLSSKLSALGVTTVDEAVGHAKVRADYEASRALSERSLNERAPKGVGALSDRVDART